MKRWFLLLSLLVLACTWVTPVRSSDNVVSIEEAVLQQRAKRYLLPAKHPLKKVLDTLCSPYRPLANEEEFKRAGFRILLTKHSSATRSGQMRLARHPFVPGYLFKVYLETETGMKKDEGLLKLTNRCEGAENIRRLIEKKKLRHFTVPDKHLYRVPHTENSRQKVVLVVTEMHLVSRPKCIAAWKNATKRQVQELYCILSHGYSSPFLIDNIPYTEEGKFVCLDTEYTKRKVKMFKVRRHLSEEMQLYWDLLTSRAE